METAYVYMRNEIVGKAQIYYDGLYVRFCCACELPTGSMYKIWVIGSCGKIGLGILAPEDKKYTLDKRVAVKYIGMGEIHLTVSLLHDQIPCEFIQIQCDKPFSQLDKLHLAKFTLEGDRAGVYFDGDM